MLYPGTIETANRRYFNPAACDLDDAHRLIADLTTELSLRDLEEANPGFTASRCYSPVAVKRDAAAWLEAHSYLPVAYEWGHR